MKLYLVQTYTGFLADGYIELCELKINCNSFTVTVNTMPAKICWLKNKWWAFFLSFFFFFFWVVNQFISNTYTWRVKLCLAMFGHIIYSNKCWIHKKWVTSISIFFFHLYLMNPLRKENNLSPKKKGGQLLFEPLFVKWRNVLIACDNFSDWCFSLRFLFCPTIKNKDMLAGMGP